MKHCTNILVLMIFLAIPPPTLASGPLFGPPAPYGVGNDPWAVTTGDFDEDGFADVAVANYSSGDVSILLGDGNGAFGAAASYSVGSALTSLAPGDFDEDGHLDLAVTIAMTDSVAILAGAGNGTFSPFVCFSVGDVPYSVATGDFNEDGHADLAAANWISDNVSILLGAGDGSFAPAVNYGAGNNAKYVMTEDFNGDGHADLAVGHDGSSRFVSVLLGVGDGTFGAAANYGVGDYPRSVSAGDFNGDGHLDLATANYSSHNVSVLLGIGDGTFGTATGFATGDYPQSVVAGDFDGDGNIDLLTAVRYRDEVSMLAGNGDGTFSSPAYYGAGDYPIAIAAADFDGDGDHDLAVPNNDLNTVSILLSALNHSITGIPDIPNDQGRRVRIRWSGSYHDDPGTSLDITGYAVYRRIDHALASAGAGAARGEPDDPFNGSSARHENPDGPFAGGSMRSVLLYPPGNWDYITSIPATAEQEYSAVAPTLADSTIAGGMYYTTFFVRALSTAPGVHVDAQPDSGYSVDNLAPAAPEGFAVEYNTGSGNQLVWEECEDEDFRYYNIFRGESADFVPDELNLVHKTSGAGWLDTIVEGWRYHYKISSVDFSGNESAAVGPGQITGIEAPDIPISFSLHQNYPNPFNPSTTIRFDIPARTSVTLTVFDVTGARLRTLIDGPITAGAKRVVWDGRDDAGKPVASGIYFYRLAAGVSLETRKMILLR